MDVTRPLVVGIGNPLAGDDAAGRFVARQLSAHDVPFDVAESSGDAADLLPLLQARDDVIIVDACHSGAKPGTVFRFNSASSPLPARMNCFSSHGFGLAAGIELARALGALPSRCLVYAIEGSCFEVGAAISPAVLNAASHLVDEILSTSSHAPEAGTADRG